MDSTDRPETSRLQIATLAGGCFWCLEAGFGRLRGVERVVSGYMGGHVVQPSYAQVCGGDTGHAEVVQIHFDPQEIGYRDLLEVFFVIHDPTTVDRQGNDVGSQYRSAIFYHDSRQKADAEAAIATLTADRVFPAAIVTEVAEAGPFWPAEDYHRDYFDKNPRQPYCLFVVAPKVAKVRAKFATRLKSPD